MRQKSDKKYHRESARLEFWGHLKMFGHFDVRKYTQLVKIDGNLDVDSIFVRFDS